MNIKEIAKKVGVSQTTVTNVINGNVGKMKRDTFQKIEQEIIRSGYVKRVAPMLLSGNGKKMVGVIIAEDENNKAITSSGWMLIAFEKEAFLMDYYVVIHCSAEKEDIVKFLKTWNLSGVMYLSLGDAVIRQIENEYPIPYISRKILHKSQKREETYQNAVKDFFKLLSDKTLLC